MDSGEHLICQYFNNGAVLSVSFKTGQGVVMFKGEPVKHYDRVYVSQHPPQDNVQFNVTLNVRYDLPYAYGTEDGKMSQLASVKDVNYRTEETPGENKIENNHVYLYDKNGNLIYVNLYLSDKGEASVIFRKQIVRRTS